ncbi:MAG: DUF47 family protein [Desulfurococcus sp.]|nr:DUF47 family protein [Desulfurococcus sp.]
MSLPLGRHLEQILTDIKELARIVESGILKLHEMIKELPSGYDAVSKLYSELDVVEKHGDELKRSVMSELKASYLHPGDREVILEFTLLLDDALGFAKAAGKRILIVLGSGVRIDGELLRLIEGIVLKSIEASRKLIDLLGYSTYTGDPSRILSLSNEIEQLEEEIDELRLKAIEKIYASCVKTLGPQCIMLPPIIDDLEEISDVFENLADIYRILIVSR